MAKETSNHLNAARRYSSINPLLTMNHEFRRDAV